MLAQQFGNVFMMVFYCCMQRRVAEYD